MNDNYRAYNIQTKDEMVTIERKSGLKISTSEQMIIEYQMFCTFLDGLIDSKII
jgi:hypothetical protein